MSTFRDAFSGSTGLGYLQAQMATDVSAVPTPFQTDFISALWRHQIDVSALDPNTLDNLMMAAWNDPFLQDEYNDAGLISMVSPIERQLFGTSASSPSTNKALLSQGLGLLSSQGIPLTDSQRNALGLSNATGAISQQQRTPYMFDPRFFNSAGGFTFGQQVPTTINGMPGYSSGIHEGTDYELPMNTPIYAPVAGTVHTVPGAVGYGNELILTLQNGWSIRLGHLNTYGVTDGTVVNPGDFLATSGSTGTSTGPHLLMEWRDPSGGAHNPNDLLDPIFAGETLGQTALRLQDPNAAGSGLSYDPHLDAQFPGVAGMWAKYFGSRPTPEQVAQVLAAAGGSADAKAMEDYIRGLPSHIAGMTAGQYTDLRNAADALSQKILGHDATDSIVKELFDQSRLTDQAITNWYNFHGITGNAAAGTTQVGNLSAATYNAIYAANQPTMSGIYGESGFDPRTAVAQYNSIHHLPGEDQGIEPPDPTDQAQVADILTVPFQSQSGYITDTPPPPEIALTPPPPDPRQSAKPMMNQ